MSKVLTIPNELVFSPCKVDGEFWSQFHTLISYLGDLESLIALRDNNPDQFVLVIEPFLRFVKVTEEELGERGLLKEVDLGEHTQSSEPPTSPLPGDSEQTH